MTEIAPVRLTSLSHGAGCACKIGQSLLNQILSRIPQFPDPAVLVGTATSDDAAVYQLPGGTQIVQTLDFFTPVVDEAMGLLGGNYTIFQRMNPAGSLPH